MCAPVIGGLMVVGAIQQAQAAKANSKANQQLYTHQANMNTAVGEQQAAVERNRATVAEYQAKDALERGAMERTQRQLQTKQLTGAQRARFAAAGLDLNEGSAAAVLADTRFLGERDELIIQDNANKEAWMYRESARTGMSNADFIRRQSVTNTDFLRRRAASENPSGAFTTSLIGSAGQVASSWYGMSRQSTY